MNRLITLILMVFSSIVYAECPSSDPEETLECYFEAVDLKDTAGISKVYLEFRTYHFTNSDKPKREIHKKVTLAKDLVKPDENGDIPIWAHKGNKEIWVREIYSNFSHMVSFYLKNKQGKWYLAGHSSHDQQE
jgi:hypothetical protein